MKCITCRIFYHQAEKRFCLRLTCFIFTTKFVVLLILYKCLCHLWIIVINSHVPALFICICDYLMQSHAPPVRMSNVLTAAYKRFVRRFYLCCRKNYNAGENGGVSHIPLVPVAHTNYTICVTYSQVGGPSLFMFSNRLSGVG